MPDAKQDPMKQYLAVSKALSDANRVRLLCALRGGELCVCQLIELLGLAPSTVSKHLSILGQAELVESRKEGRWVHYCLPRKTLSQTASRITKELFRALANSAVVLADEKALAAIRQTNVEDLCRKSG